MTKPERFLWAENTNHAAGADPWSGQPCKVEPAAGKKLTGFVPAERPPAEHMNWLLNQTGLWARWASVLQVRNWRMGDFSGVTPGADWWIPHCMCSAPVAAGGGFVSLVAVEEQQHYVIRSSVDDTVWTAEGGAAGSLANLWGAPAAAHQHINICANSGGALVAVSDDGATNDLAATSPLAPNWGAIAALALTVRWRACENDWKATPSAAGTTVVGAHTGLLYVYNSTLGAWTTAGTPYAAAVDVIKHTHDTANSYFLAAVTDRVIKSATGLSGTWSVITPSWGAFACSGLGYDADSKRWIAVGYGTAGDLWYSDDDGATWSSWAGAVPMLSANGRKSIACDGHGCWVVTGSTELTGTDDPMYWSVDNGATWNTLAYPTAFASGVAYHNGHFVTCGYSAGYRSLLG